jgi:hypothetical protein
MWLIQSSQVLIHWLDRRSGRFAEVSEKIQANEVIPSRQEEDPQHNSQPKPEPHILGALP